jgi:excisionase family DNA binding protein
MPTPHLLRTFALHRVDASGRLGSSGRIAGNLAHLVVMNTTNASATNPTTLSLVDGVLSLAELCEQLQVSTQTIYDLRSQGRGPRGFRVGRELRFRISEIDAWLARLEAEDDRRHRAGGR